MSREIEEIKAKLDIADIIGGYLRLTPAGVNFKANCPFHNEKTPSFMVNKSKQLWRCFGCNEGGDIFEFVMKIENLDFAEALKMLAQKAGVQLSRSEPGMDSQKNRLFSLCNLSARYWHQVLLKSSQAETARNYLQTRGLSSDAIDDFCIGYSMDSWDDLINFLRKKGFTDNEIFLAGLSVKKERGNGFYDRFRGRIMFPIYDLSGRIVGFGGRTMKADELAKYINTSQTAIYNKSLILYGLNFAKDQIKKQDACILVEGYMDVIPSHQAGVKNVVSISGTALTIEQIKILKRYSNNLLLSLDMDTAGQMAASRSIDLALENEMNVKVITLAFGKDPGECIKNNPQDWTEAIGKAQNVMDYFLTKIMSEYDMNTQDGRKLIVKFLLEKINKMANPLDKDFWLKKLAQKISVSENSLRELMSRLSPERKSSFGTYKKEKPALVVKNSNREVSLIKRILELSLAYPLLLSKAVSAIEIDYFEDELAGGVYKKLVLFYTKNSNLISGSTVDNSQFDLFDGLKQWFDEAESDKSQLDLVSGAFFSSQNVLAEENEKSASAEMAGIIRLLKDEYLKRRIEFLKIELQKAEREAPERVENIYHDLQDLISRRRD
ncbi:MAG: DNA primase [bacterium]